jgi:CheY-like chemotaxis protein
MMVSFIVIDDSELDCFLAQKIIEYTDKTLITDIYHKAEDALKAIIENHTEDSRPPTIIFLDLQMPMMNGFKFVEEFEKLPPEVQKNYFIIILSILSPAKDPVDIHRILTFGTVKSILAKPLTKEKLFSLLIYLDAAI